MSTPLPLQTFADILALARIANCLSWHRDSKALSLILDDVSGDLRTCVDLRVERLHVEVRKLNGYDPKKNVWKNYCSTPLSITLPDKKGLKALLSYLADEAQVRHGYPNPAFLSVYRTATEAVVA